jgi:hypothetical protein
MQILFWRWALPLRYAVRNMGRIDKPSTNGSSRRPATKRRAWIALAPAAGALALGVMGSMVDFLAHGLVDASYFVIDLAFVYFLSFAVVVWVSEDKM